MSSSPAARRRTGSLARSNLSGWGFAAPFLAFFVVFLVWPVLYGIYMSLTGKSLTGANDSVIGFANYAEAFADADMWRSLGNTLYFTVISTVPLVLVALVMAALLNAGLPAQWLWRLSYFAPYLLASTVVSLFFSWMYNPQLGLINDSLSRIGIPKVAWLNDPNVAMWAIVIATLWWTVGFNFLLYLAAMQNIPQQHYEAASLDGAGAWRQLFSITLPQLGPTTVMIVLLQVLASLKIFDQVYQMTAGGPGGSTRPVVQYIFETGFTGYRLGYSAAISYIFFGLIVVVSVMQFVITRRRSA
ncbi:sugar ABC transporter permease [Arthrobacter sp. FX8]|jgi:multiple sugar transport system permease protein/raffinose/stachyose/melibiose transport system permease protein|uniref:carbohydrate ABC transporter permease n=1 Tax=Micrococcaceae TaxID=1268 RepID=UPI000373CAAD|nr:MULTISPECIES: sugar ABC transporter permease [unclassified Arthrobacter]KRE66246.1 sugar ABC transporter permease [Arthrobacter sp. Soil761]TWD50874.1 carbohydrate ABC transporter membrane protein 1 (CUT1 family) [Arthrobacter sp. AG367]WAJ32235.1 sugar ABC transporter permease [Arthrobacter sp. FX8]BCW55964.1 sugar ABC transporter permease [Arthrobacter sp. StoSoilB19]BCW77062.1 sugar ABC transporter permease [Arthrobacter sp. NicSoilB11]